MIYNVNNTSKIGLIVTGVFDADRKEYFDTMEVDTETGRIVHAVRDHQGFILVDPRTNDLVVRTVTAPAPILVLFTGEPRRHPHHKDTWKYVGCRCRFRKGECGVCRTAMGVPFHERPVGRRYG